MQPNTTNKNINTDAKTAIIEGQSKPRTFYEYLQNNKDINGNVTFKVNDDIYVIESNGNVKKNEKVFMKISNFNLDENYETFKNKDYKEFLKSKALLDIKEFFSNHILTYCPPF